MMILHVNCIMMMKMMVTQLKLVDVLEGEPFRMCFREKKSGKNKRAVALLASIIGSAEG